MLHQFVTDLRFGARMFRRAPLFTAVVVATIGLGVGATTALVTVVDGVLLNPLPYADAGRIVNLWQGRRAMGIERDWFSGAQYVDVRDGTDVFESLALGGGASVIVTDRGAPTEAGFVAATSSLLTMLGVRPLHGRLLDVSDDQEGAASVVMLTHTIWQRLFGGDPAAVGQTITINQTMREIVGVLPPDFRLDNEVLPTVGGDGSIEIIGSLRLTEARLANRGSENYNVIGKLKPGVTVAQAQSQVDAIAQSIIERYEANAESGFFMAVVPMIDDVVGSARRPILALLAAGVVLLAIACANVVNLQLARATQRHTELAIRAAIGAGRSRLIRQLLAESLVLAAAGGVAGIGFAAASLTVLRRLGGSGLPRLDEIGVDGTVALGSVALVTVTTLAIGLAPALRASRVHLHDSIRAGARGTVHGRASWGAFNLSSGLVILEIALAVVVLVGAGLLARSFRALQQVDPGFTSDNVMTFRVGLLDRTDDERATAYFHTLEERMEAVPSVRAAGGVHLLPFTVGASWGTLDVEGREPDEETIAHFRIATPHYFDAMSIPLLRGRAFDQRDHAQSTPVVIVDQRVVDQVFPGQDPIGLRIEGWTSEWAEIVGVVGSVKMLALDQNEPLMAYYPMRQVPTARLYFSVRGAIAETGLAATVERTAREIDPEVLVTDVTPMRQRVLSSLAQRRFAMVLFQAFGLAALILAAVGIYGLVAYRVNLASRELGMRVALGAQRRDIITMVVRHGMTLATVGVILGVAASAGVTRLMTAMLFGVTPTDVATFASVGGFLVAVTLLACFLPARRAARQDPLVAIRAE